MDGTAVWLAARAGEVIGRFVTGAELQSPVLGAGLVS